MSSESRSLRTEMLLKRFSCTIEKFEKRLLNLKSREIKTVNHVRRPLPTKLNVTAVAADRLMKSSDKKEDCAVVFRRVAAKCESNVLTADAILMKRQKLEKNLFCPNTSDKTEGRTLVRRVVAIDHKPIRRPPSANEGLDAGRRVATKCESNALPVDALLMRKRRNELEMERKNLKRREAMQKKREAARRELEQMRNTAGIYDPSELVRDLEKMLGYSITGYMPQPALPIPDYYKSLIKTDDMISCCEDGKKVDEEVEEGETVD